MTQHPVRLMVRITQVKQIGFDRKSLEMVAGPPFCCCCLCFHADQKPVLEFWFDETMRQRRVAVERGRFSQYKLLSSARPGRQSSRQMQRISLGRQHPLPRTAGQHRFAPVKAEGQPNSALKTLPVPGDDIHLYTLKAVQKA